jgi:hypothetical protein
VVKLTIELMKFNLGKAHPEYRQIIPSVLTGLLAKYPFVPLKEVHLFDPATEDQSMGNATVPGVIALNSFWFAQDPELLRDAGQSDIMVCINGYDIAWHGKMVNEPEHLLTHEFGHILSQVLPEWHDWTCSRWEKAMINPQLAPSGYALGTPSEYFAEMFALVELGLADETQTEDFYRLLK